MPHRGNFRQLLEILSEEHDAIREKMNHIVGLSFISYIFPIPL